MRPSMLKPWAPRPLVVAVAVALLASASSLGLMLLRPAPAREVAPPIHGVFPSAELYWWANVDPTIAPGVQAPLGQFLIRTDSPSLYYKSGTTELQWTKIGTAGVTPGSIAPSAFANGTQNGQTFEWDGVSWALADYCSDPVHRWCVVDDFVSGSTVCQTAGLFFQGTGTSCTLSGDADHPGIFSLRTDTAGSRITANPLGTGVVFGSHQLCDSYLVRFPVLGAATVDYFFRGGFGEFTTLGNSVDAVQAVYDRAAGGQFWELETRANSVSTVMPTTCAIAANTWYKVQLCVNAAATSATLNVNNTLCATSTTTIPSGAARITTFGFQALPNTGATTYAVDLDWVAVDMPSNRPP